tara:strand:+ start:1463 stop:1795 length:333 start_codon:yes stop_codon:yes gene_type:complete
MAKAKRRKVKRSAHRGELPGEYLKRSLVTVPSGFLSEGGRIKDMHYVVKTTRLDGDWAVTVEHRGEEYRLPHKVVLQVQRHMASIVKAGRQDRAVERAQRIVTAVTDFGK